MWVWAGWVIRPTLGAAFSLVHNFLARQPTPSRLAAWRTHFTRPESQGRPFHKTLSHVGQSFVVFEWCFVHAKQAIEQPKKAHNSYRLLKNIAGFGAQPDRLEAALQLLRAILAKPSDELRWSIQFKELAPVISLGLASGNPKIKRAAEECLNSILNLGCSDFLNLGKE